MQNSFWVVFLSSSQASHHQNRKRSMTKSKTLFQSKLTVLKSMYSSTHRSQKEWPHTVVIHLNINYKHKGHINLLNESSDSSSRVLIFPMFPELLVLTSGPITLSIMSWESFSDRSFSIAAIELSGYSLSIWSSSGSSSRELDSDQINSEDFFTRLTTAYFAFCFRLYWVIYF
jgi:hypothetical protein